MNGWLSSRLGSFWFRFALEEEGRELGWGAAASAQDGEENRAAWAVGMQQHHGAAGFVERWRRTGKKEGCGYWFCRKKKKLSSVLRLEKEKGGACCWCFGWLGEERRRGCWGST